MSIKLKLRTLGLNVTDVKALFQTIYHNPDTSCITANKKQLFGTMSQYLIKSLNSRTLKALSDYNVYNIYICNKDKKEYEFFIKKNDGGYNSQKVLTSTGKGYECLGMALYRYVQEGHYHVNVDYELIQKNLQTLKEAWSSDRIKPNNIDPNHAISGTFADLPPDIQAQMGPIIMKQLLDDGSITQEVYETASPLDLLSKKPDLPIGNREEELLVYPTLQSSEEVVDVIPVVDNTKDIPTSVYAVVKAGNIVPTEATFVSDTNNSW